jgi:hypothetical protein
MERKVDPNISVFENIQKRIFRWVPAPWEWEPVAIFNCGNNAFFFLDKIFVFVYVVHRFYF